MNISSNNFGSIELMRDQLKKNNSKPNASQQIGGSPSFESILTSTQSTKAAEGIKFSKHASERLSSRNIDLTDEQLDKLQQGMSKAKAKGINESLVIVDGVSFIVSCKNNTVITAIGEEDEHIFTNIDGAVIM